MNKSLQKLVKLSMVSMMALSVINVVVNNTTKVYAATESDVESNMIQNGSFEQPDISTYTESKHYQGTQDQIPYWKTTETDNKIELFMENSYYIENVDLKPTDGKQAAEINAEESSTLYQEVHTNPGSVYLWGLDHRARFGTDTMALVIGPSQTNDPKKADDDKTNNDQLQQMVEWLKNQSIYQTPTTGAEPTPYTIYTKKFNDNGGFENNDDNEPFSLVYDTTYTEPFTIWIIQTTYSAWKSYGSNAIGSDETSDVVNDWGNINAAQIDSLSYAYKVPSSQTSTIFGFVAVDTGFTGADDKKYTVGNFIDNINFEIYNNLSASSTDHGSGAVSASSSTVAHSDITKDNSINIYTKYGSNQELTAKVDATNKSSVVFSGAYITENNGTRVFLTKGKWTETTDNDGNLYYTYSLNNVTYAVDVHYVFLRSPYITYDANGGTYEVSTGSDVYDFTPTSPTEESGAYTFKDPYTSSSATASEGWVFQGWALYDENGEVKDTNNNSIILNGVHTIACDYDTSSDKQTFKVINGSNTFTTTPNTTNVTNTTTDGNYIYNKATAGLTLVAQWKFTQQIIPQTKLSGAYTNSETGGTVTYKGVTPASGENGSKTYDASTDEVIEVIAAPEENFDFEGWYDSQGNLITVNKDYSYTVEKGKVITLYAKFSPKTEQKYIRQVKNSNNEWTTIENTATVDSNNHKYPPLSCYENHGVDGSQAVSRAEVENGDHYAFVGWFDTDGNQVDSSKIENEDTLIYSVNGSATYIARFEQAVEVTYDYEGGTDSSNKTSKIDEVIPGNNETVSEAPTKENYEFTGWKLKGTDTIYQPTNEITNITEDITLEAQWKELPKVIYDLEGGTGAEGVDYSTKHVGTDKKTTVLSSPTKENYEFTGWKLKDSDTIYQPTNEIANITQDITLEAQWKELPKITYDLDGGEGSDGSDYSTKHVEEGGEVTLPNAPSKDGYDFSGWRVDGSDTIYQPGDVIENITSDTNIVAVWNEKKVEETPVPTKNDNDSTSKKDTNNNTKKETPHNTGDESNIVLWSSLMIVSIMMMGVLVIKKKKYN